MSLYTEFSYAPVKTVLISQHKNDGIRGLRFFADPTELQKQAAFSVKSYQLGTATHVYRVSPVNWAKALANLTKVSSPEHSLWLRNLDLAKAYQAT